MSSPRQRRKEYVIRASRAYIAIREETKRRVWRELWPVGLVLVMGTGLLVGYFIHSINPWIFLVVGGFSAAWASRRILRAVHTIRDFLGIVLAAGVGVEEGGEGEEVPRCGDGEMKPTKGGQDRS
ncbi:MAG: hypothetical protein ACE5LX_09620 [Nitrospinota bacterium]